MATSVLLSPDRGDIVDSFAYQEIQEALNRIIFLVTEKMTGNRIRHFPHCPPGDLYCVSTKFEGNCDLSLALFASRCFFRRLAQRIFQEPDITEEDMSEAAKEYLNVICGRLIGQVSSLIHRPACFSTPVFHGRCNIPSSCTGFCSTSQYIDENNEGITLILALSSPKSDNPSDCKCALK